MQPSHLLNQKFRKLTRRAMRYGISISDSKRVVKREIQRVRYMRRHVPRGIKIHIYTHEYLVRGKISRDEFRQLQESWLCLVRESKQAQPVQQPLACHMAAPRRARQRGASSRSSASSGDGNSDSSDPEPERPPLLQLFSFSSAAAILDCSPQTLRNKVCLGLIPAPIQTVVGPRFTQDQLRQITSPKPKPADVAPPVAVRRKVGRPRLASAVGKGGAS